jgi:hypothetical protein
VNALTLLLVVLAAAVVVPFLWTELPGALRRRWTARRGSGPGGTATG